MREYTIRQMNMKISQFDTSEYRCSSEYFSPENSYYFVQVIPRELQVVVEAMRSIKKKKQLTE